MHNVKIVTIIHTDNLQPKGVKYLAHIELKIAQLYYIFEADHIVDMLHVKKIYQRSLQNDLQKGPIFTQHIGTISHHRTRISPEGGLLDNSDVNYHWSVDCCCWVRLESKVEEIIVVHVIFHLLIFEQILVFVIVIHHLFLQAHFHCLFLFAHNEEECTSVLWSVWVFGEAFLWEAFRDFLAHVDGLEEFLLHGLWDGGGWEFIVSLLVFSNVDLVILSEISHLVHDAGEVSDLAGHMVLQFVVVVKLSLSLSLCVGSRDNLLVVVLVLVVLLVGLSHLSVKNLVVVDWLEANSWSIEWLWLLVSKVLLWLSVLLVVLWLLLELLVLWLLELLVLRLLVLLEW